MLDFCRLIGIEPRRGTGENASDGLYQTALHYVQRRFGQDLVSDPANAGARAYLWRQITRLPHVPFRIAPGRLRQLLETHADDCDWMRQRLPELDMTQGLEPREGMAEIADPDDLCAIALGLEGQVRNLIRVPVPDQADPMLRIAGMLTAISLIAKADQSALRATIAHQLQVAGPLATPPATDRRGAGPCVLSKPDRSRACGRRQRGGSLSSPRVAQRA